MRKNIFWIFGILQSVSLSVLIYIVLNSLDLIYKGPLVGKDSIFVLSAAFPTFLLIVEYIIYTKE
ncbi:MAG TPA: hypothetical protein VKN64_11465 [Halanaerobiales bacterium]|nr:hypothetical protein [Halanaerobiales bacterium]